LPYLADVCNDLALNDLRASIELFKPVGNEEDAVGTFDSRTKGLGLI
jgi:hypothetical protein